MGAVIGHLVDVGRAGNVGLGSGETAVRIGGHAEDVGLDDPVVGVDIGEPEPVGEFAGREAAEVGEIGEDHEAGDVVRPALVNNLLDDGVHAVKAGGDAPVDGREGEIGVEGGGGGSGVGVFFCEGVSGCGFRGLVGRGFLRSVAFFLGNVGGEETVAVGLLVEVAHELAPAEELTDEAFGAGERDEAVTGGCGYVADEVEGQKAAKVEQDGGLGVEELEVVVAHGVFEGAEVGEEFGEGELPEGVAIGLGAGEIEAVWSDKCAEVVGVGGFDQVEDFRGDGIGREGGRSGDGDLAFVGVAVVGVEGELAADGLGVGHEDAGLLAHFAVEAVHHKRLAVLVGAVDGEEVGCGGGPGGVLDEVHLETGFDGGGEVEAELALGGGHAGERRKVAVALELEEGLAVAGGREMVEDFDALGGLLQGEVAHVGDEDGEFFLVVRAAKGLGGGLDDDDAGLGGRLFGEGAGAVGVAVVGDVDPAAGGDVVCCGLGGRDEVGEEGHESTVAAGRNPCLSEETGGGGFVGGIKEMRACFSIRRAGPGVRRDRKSFDCAALRITDL